MSDPERRRIADALSFELGKVETKAVRERVIEHLNHVDHEPRRGGRGERRASGRPRRPSPATVAARPR